MTQQAREFWNNAAEKYAKSPIGDMEAYEYTLRRTKSYLKKTDHILEVGCGTGSTALLLSRVVEEIVASDLSENMIEIANRKADAEGISNINFVQSDVYGPSIEGGGYDVVLALNIIHLLEDTAGVMNRLSELVKPGGYFISKTVCKPGKGLPWKFRLLLLALPLMQMVGKAPFVKFMEIEELEKSINDAGFKILETGNHPAKPPSRFVVAQKL